jgi:hypothetical protein
MTEELTVYEGETTAVVPAQVGALEREPRVVLEEAHRAAKALKDVLDKKERKVVFNNRQYLESTDWQTIGRFYGITAKTKSVKYISYDLGEDVKVVGFEAEAVAIRNGEEIGGAMSLCLSDEPNWAKKPLFQISSMAQTRAQAKALRSVLGFVVVLAGYEATPAEEMTGNEGNGHGGPLVRMPQRTAPAPAPTAPRAVSNTNANDGEIGALTDFTVLDVEEQSGVKNNKPWTRYTLHTDSGHTIKTFNKDLATVARTAKDAGAKLSATYKNTKFGYDLLTLEGAEEARAANQDALGFE